ncbi:acetyltransferase [Taibaiella sp. KBW10]|uniref:acetyltransferase n=1 Tax=Taibaiella sp. KBW10 TaxID=2153357 RepID=UPI000F5B8674|nr:acetyltransferase [Taibaiella sp. KBW10]RQO31920.1 acetyltransferase [Taibaiella sp. KBW10]
MNTGNFILYGASGHGSVILDTLETGGHDVEYFIDDNPNLTIFENVAVISRIGFDNLVKDKARSLIISIGNNKIRKAISTTLSDYDFGQAIHGKAVVSRKVSVGQGTVIMAGAIINANVTIGRHAIVNTGASIDHDCVIADYVHISPGATLCGNVVIEEGVHVGAGATIIPGVRIGAWATIGAGAVVRKDVPNGAMAVGNPVVIKNAGNIK